MGRLFFVRGVIYGIGIIRDSLIQGGDRLQAGKMQFSQTLMQARTAKKHMLFFLPEKGRDPPQDSGTIFIRTGCPAGWKRDDQKSKIIGMKVRNIQHRFGIPVVPEKAGDLSRDQLLAGIQSAEDVLPVLKKLPDLCVCKRNILSGMPGDLILDQLQIIILLQGFDIFGNRRCLRSIGVLVPLLKNRLLHDFDQFFRRKRFQEILYSTSVKCLFHIVEIFITADDDQRNTGIFFRNHRQQSQTVQNRHFHVGDDDIRVLFFDHFKPFFTVAGLTDTAQLIHQW